MKSFLCAFIAGFIFSIGLGISGMTMPTKVIGFLDIFGSWDPTLAFVMIGAIAVHGFVYQVFVRRHIPQQPWWAKEWSLSARKEITPSLVGGALIFGVGWGLGGYCPGPALTSLASLQIRPLIFVLSMAMGMLLFHFIQRHFKKLGR